MGALGGGALFYSVSPEGKVVDDRTDCYGHSFVIFGLSHAARATRERKYREAAFETWAAMKERLRDEAGFYRPGVSRDFSETRGRYSRNPMMHLFEELLALCDATGSPEILKEAEDHANAMFAQGSGQLFDEEGGIHSAGDYDGNPVPGRKSWWQQCELLRALMHYATLRDRTDLWKPFDQSLEFVKRRFIDPEYGGWFEHYAPEWTREGKALHKGNVYRVGYHVCGMYGEALRLTGISRAR